MTRVRLLKLVFSEQVAQLCSSVKSGKKERTSPLFLPRSGAAEAKYEPELTLMYKEENAAVK